ncbi:hybrid sensor histidine kinase/response regulator [Burkholderia cepacia]|uniref:hybrid sensor histidine kinase/response regulator n=1 Tax=Burkholderia cepacia TaxID=292 RepID=UPI000754EEED|nr:hybrid sensor histidine kinase/response regulator [Burkholderia cepacia]KVL06114.1 hybrid sensor histidine kinase/response regulator [Burkholderia cepacia]
MPTKLKKLAAQFAAPGRKSFEPGRVRRQQLALLYGGGAAITVFILVCAALVVRLEVFDYFTQVRGGFLKREAQLQGELQSTTLLLGQYANNSQSLWASGAQPPPGVLRKFADDRGRIVRDRLGRAEFAGFGDITPEHPASTYSPYLALILQQFDAAATQVPVDAGLSGYLIGLRGDFLGVFGPELVGPALAMRDGASLKALIAQLTPLDDGARARAPGAVETNAVVLERRVDPLLGRAVLRFVRRLNDADGRPFAWAVVNGRPRIADILAPRAIGESFALVDARADVLAGTPPGAGLVARALDIAHASSGERVVARLAGARLVIGDRLPNADLVLMVALSWRRVLAAIAMPVGLTLGTALLAVALLWFAIVVFDRRALRPANRRAIRLIESEALNRALIRSAPAGLMLLSVVDGDTMACNDAARAYEKATPGTPLGKRIWQAYRDAAQGRPLSRVVTRELSVEPDGEGATCFMTNIVRTRFRGVDVLLCMLLDITASKQVEYTLREAREAAEDANRAKSTFLATMSHEIRTPLNAIVGNLELMARAALPPQEQRRLKTIMSSSDALLAVINDVLDLSKAESNQMVLERIPFDLRAVLRDVTAIFRPAADAQHLTLDCRLAPDLADGYVGDPTRLRQLVSNLVSNGVKFTKRGGVTVDARVATDDAGVRRVEIAVRDTGIGIPEPALPTLFDVYMQADASIYRRFGGTGLGLPLCRRIARLMHGELTVDSRVDEGSTFVAVLPLPEAPPDWREAFADVDPSPAVEAERVQAAAHGDTSPLRVLVAEDHPASRALLRDQLGALGHEATLVTNGIEAMRAFFEGAFDVVLTDLGMPELDGFALTRFLREQGAAVPVIAMTAHATDEDYRRCAQAGAAEVVLKPLSISVLDAVLRRHAGAGAVPGHAPVAHDERPVVSAEIRETLRSATLQSIQSIDAALARGDIPTIGVELHSMRGGFALVGDTEVRDACAAMERVVDSDAFAANWPDFRHTLERALTRLGR